MHHRNIFKISLFIGILFLATGLGFDTAYAKDKDDKADKADKSDDKGASEQAEHLDHARDAYLELLNIPDQKIPQDLLARAKCIAVFPGVVKGALGWGGRYGHGVMSCRDAQGNWSPPSFLTIAGGSVGFQIGVEKDAIVLFFMTEDGARSLVKSKFTLGGNGSVAAGPFGRTAEASTDVKLNAEIYSYAKSKGLFAGISLEGAHISADKNANAKFYGSGVTPEALLFEHKAPTMPPAAARFVDALPH
jgi:lipid-binding SYLF domain-containing protein